MRDVIPKAVFEAIQEHLHEQTKHAEAGWDAGSEDEDTLTGDLGSSLRTKGWIASTRGAERWEWRVTYKKFRGHGKGALESTIGADGIFQIEVRGGELADIVTKGVLFQAKKYKGSSRSALRTQVNVMEDRAPGGSAVVEYGPDGYRAEAGRGVLVNAGKMAPRIPHPSMPLGVFLADSFLPCESGLRGMYYDAVRNVLAIPVKGSEPRLLHMKLGHRFAIEARRSR